MLAFNIYEAFPEVTFLIGFESSELFLIRPVSFGVMLDKLSRSRFNVAYFLIHLAVCGKTAPSELAVNKVGNEGINENKHGNAEKHTCEAEKTGTYNDGEHDPEAVDTDNVAENLGSQEVAVKLLQQNNKHGKDQRFHGRHHENNHNRGNCADERSEERNNIGYADYNRDEHRVRHSKNCAANVANNTYDRAVKNSAGNKSVEDAVYKANAHQNLFSCLHGEDAVNKLLHICAEGFAVIENIYGCNHTDDDVVYTLQHGNHTAGYIAHETSQLRNYSFNPAENGFGYISYGYTEGGCNFRVVRKEFFYPRIDGVNIVAAVEHYALKACYNLRSNQPDKRRNKRNQSQHGKEHRETSMGVFMLELLALSKLFIYKRHQGAENTALIDIGQGTKKVGNNKTPYKRTEYCNNPAYGPSNYRKLGDNEIKRH